jgi:hypothetical protein
VKWVKERAKEADEKRLLKRGEGTSNPDSIACHGCGEPDSDVSLEEVVALRTSSLTGEN